MFYFYLRKVWYIKKWEDAVYTKRKEDHREI